MITSLDVIHSRSIPQGFATKLNLYAQTDVVTGKTAGQVLTGLNGTVTSVTAILAVVTSTGAFATKALLAVTTDYTVSATGAITCVTDQSLNKLIVIYK